MRHVRARLTRRLLVVITGALLTLVGQRVEAAPIALVTYEVDSIFGPVFTFENFSDSTGFGGSFESPTIQFVSGTTQLLDAVVLQLADLPNPAQPHYQLGQTVDDLTPIADALAALPAAPTLFDVVLTLNFSIPGVVPTQLRISGLSPLGSDPVAASDCPPGALPSQACYPVEVNSTAVPEPGTLLLLTSGLGAALVRRRRSPRA